MRNPSAEQSPKTTSIISPNKKNILAKTLSVLPALLVWQLVSMLIGSEILLVSPLEVLARLFEMVGEEGFFSSVWFSFSRIGLGFFSGLLLGIVFALLAGRLPIMEKLLWPYMVTVKSVPVASFVVIALVWFTSSSLVVLISFLMVLPIVYTNLLEGIRSVDVKMLEMADVFRMPFHRRLKYIWLPSVRPFLLSGVRVSLGLAWKSGVAAELIGIPDGSLGEALYYSKLFLNTADLFAWTVVIVLASVLFEKLFVFLLDKAFEGVGKS